MNAVFQEHIVVLLTMLGVSSMLFAFLFKKEKKRRDQLFNDMRDNGCLDLGMRVVVHWWFPSKKIVFVAPGIVNILDSSELGSYSLVARNRRIIRDYVLGSKIVWVKEQWVNGKLILTGKILLGSAKWVIPNVSSEEYRCFQKVFYRERSSA